MYWEWKDERNIEYKKYHEKKAIEYAEREIKKNTNNDERILDLFRGMNLKQGINIHKNTETNQIYVFTTPSKHQSILSIYDYDKESLILKKQIKIWHLYEVYDGIYDDKTNKIYLGVLHLKFNEGTWGNNSMDGYAIVNLDYMEKINNILGVQ